MTGKPDNYDFDALVAAIRRVHEHVVTQVGKAVNISLTLRNWVIGAYIAEYELHGQDRAQYGEKLLPDLAARLADVSNCNRRQLYDYMRFYRTYPQIVGTASAQLQPVLPKSLTEYCEKVPTVSAQLEVPPQKLINNLSYSHFKLLVECEEALQRTFYEIECIRGNWSVRTLKRQIATLYFERSGLSKDKEKLAAMVRKGAEVAEPKLAIRDPYIFEFLGLRSKDAVAESDLEAALVEHLREFLLELGHGFCLEAQQKSIFIGRTRGFVDLVFYHRVLKCHVLVDLKVDEFRHENIGQLNTYVTWYRKHMMSEGDNPPVGILLCTERDHTLVEYATASMDNRLFVSKYAVELPSKKELQEFLETHRRELETPGKPPPPEARKKKP